MSRGSLDQQFRAADQNGLPDVRQLDERHQVFWVLRLAQEKLDIAVMTPAEVSNVLRDVYGILISRQKVGALLSRERKTVAKRKKAGARAYQLMGAGSDELDATSGRVMFVEPSRGFSGLRETHALIATMTGEVRVCDPYVDARTLDMLAAANSASEIRLLTFNVKQAAGLKHAAKAFAQEHGVNLEIRLASSQILHDRYVIHDGGMLLFGTSLNGIGLKQSFVVALGEDIRATVLASFDGAWAQGTPL